MTDAQGTHDMINNATQALSTWIRDHGSPLTGLDLNVPLDDLEPLRDLVGDARVVALGESSHHVREFYQLRHRMLRFLVEECDFNTYVLEAPFTEGRVLEDWVAGGTGTVQQVASKGVAMSLGDVPELHEVLEWIRTRNERGDGAEVRCVGADLPGSIGSPLPALRQIASYLDHADPGARGLLDRAVALAEQFHAPSTYGGEMITYAQMGESDRDAFTAVLSALTARMERLASRQDIDGRSTEHALAAHHLRGAWLLDHVHRSLLVEGVEEASTFRDLYLAESVLRVLDADPDARIVFAAHNWHIMKTPERHQGSELLPAGFHLAAALGEEYVAVGLTSRSGHTGVANGAALDGTGGFLFREAPLPPAAQTAIESAFPEDGLVTLVDLRDVPPEVADVRSHPQMRMSDYFVDQPAFSAFDGLACVTDGTGTAKTREPDPCG